MVCRVPKKLIFLSYRRFKKNLALKEGNRHNTLLKEACYLARQHKLNDETRKELTDKYRNLEKPFPLKEIIETLDSAASYAKEYPIYPRLDNEAMEDALEALGVECRYNLRSSRAELRHEGGRLGAYK